MKRTFSIYLLSLLLGGLGFSLDLNAGIYSLLIQRSATKLAKEMKREARKIDEGLVKTDRNEFIVKANSGHWSMYLQNIRLRIRPYINFKIPIIASLRIYPQLEFEWSRNPPKGWRNYTQN